MGPDFRQIFSGTDIIIGEGNDSGGNNQRAEQALITWLRGHYSRRGAGNRQGAEQTVMKWLSRL